jgi:DNA-binding NtrC family response regulator
LSQLRTDARIDIALASRLDPVTLAVPPLRDRREDLSSLVLLALDRLGRVHGRSALGIETDAMQALVDYRFDGNEAELLVLVDRAAARSGGPRITLADLRLPRLGASVAPTQSPLAGSFDTVEKRVLKYALAQADGNKSEAARLLGLKRTTFLDKLRRHDLDDAAPSRLSP